MIVRNLPTHPQSRAAPSPKHNTNKSRQRPQRSCGIYPRTHKSCCTIAPNQTQQHKQKPVTAATIVRNLPVGPNTNTNKKQSGNGRIDYAEFSHGGHQIPASKNVLKTSFSKGELGTRRVPVPIPVKTRTLSAGTGFWRVRVRVPSDYPRVTRDNP